MKTEFYDRRSWSTRAEARREVARWIEIVFNRRRLHSSLDYTSPVAFENAIKRDRPRSKNMQITLKQLDQPSTTCGQAHEYQLSWRPHGGSCRRSSRQTRGPSRQGRDHHPR
ncbi:hypothetical protein CIK81_15230 [Brachybacterium sp. JB7]|nr:hypothetical protein CIK81_15230 [Brachybacterium sp. JB7]